jgi:hypothetical protein
MGVREFNAIVARTLERGQSNPERWQSGDSEWFEEARRRPG